MIFSVVFAQEDTTDYSKYFPISIGNSWQYFERDLTTGIDSYLLLSIIGDTLMSNETLYYKVQWEPSCPILYFKYIRFDSSENAICVYDETSEEDSILFDLDIEVIDTTCPVYYLGDLVIVQRDSTIVTNITDYLVPKVEFSFFYCATWLRQYYLAKGIGVYFIDSAFRWPEMYVELVAARINGITYGEFVSIEEIGDLVQDYTLSQNYPNPFNSTTQISFTVPRKSEVKITLYDIRGCYIKSIVDNIYEKGQYTCNFYSKNLLSGLYIIKMESENFSTCKKCILIK